MTRWDVVAFVCLLTSLVSLGLAYEYWQDRMALPAVGLCVVAWKGMNAALNRKFDLEDQES